MGDSASKFKILLENVINKVIDQENKQIK